MRGKHVGSIFGIAGLAAAALLAGCEDRTPPPPMGAAPGYAVLAPGPRVYKPLPDPRRGELPPPPYEDAPLISQQIPEALDFVRAYTEVGKPRIVIFVNRTLQGEVVVPTNDRVERGRSETYVRSENGGPGHYEVHTERSTADLRPGQYDEAGARAIDYQAIEAKLADWLSCDGHVAIISPSVVRARLTDEQVRRLQEGRPRVLSEVAKNLDADVMIQVQAHPTQQTSRGLEIRLIAEAINIGPTHTGESLGRAIVLVPPPLDSEQVNKYTRFVARKLMADMTNDWMAPGPDDAPDQLPPLAPAPRQAAPAAPVPPDSVVPPASSAPDSTRSAAPGTPDQPANTDMKAPPADSPTLPPAAPPDGGVPPERPSLLVRPDYDGGPPPQPVLPPQEETR